MSRFVSGGTDDQPIERDEAWLKAQQDIEATRRKKEEEGRQENGKSLYETLQANKAAKQDAFEEAARLSNQFRSLDEDEIEFLDSVLESTRAKETAVKRETAEQLELFRRQQEETEKAARLAEAGAEEPAQPTESWAVRKRKRARDKDNLPGVKLRKSSSINSTSTSAEPAKVESKPTLDSTSTESAPGVARPTLDSLQQESPPDPVPTPKGVDPTSAQHAPPAIEKAVAEVVKSPTPTVEKTTSTSALGLGLAAYSSDED